MDVLTSMLDACIVLCRMADGLYLMIAPSVTVDLDGSMITCSYY